MTLIRHRSCSFMIFWLIIFTLLYLSKAEDESFKALRKKTETNIFNFLRLILLRMVYGFASMFGLGDFLEDFAGGVFAPPSSDYDGFDYGNDNDYKEYDDYNYF